MAAAAEKEEEEEEDPPSLGTLCFSSFRMQGKGGKLLFLEVKEERRRRRVEEKGLHKVGPGILFSK